MLSIYEGADPINHPITSIIDIDSLLWHAVTMHYSAQAMQNAEAGLPTTGKSSRIVLQVDISEFSSK